MRTTVDIDDALMRELSDKAHQERTCMKEILNRTLSRGLGHREKGTAKFTCPAKDMGRPRRDIDSGLALSEELEDEAVLAKMELGK
jgi:hypothetical protein